MRVDQQLNLTKRHTWKCFEMCYNTLCWESLFYIIFKFVIMCVHVCQTAAAETPTARSPHFLHERRTTKHWAALSCSSCERECVKSRGGKENNLVAWNSTAAALQPDTKHTPGTVKKKEELPWSHNTLWAPRGSWPSIVDPCPHKTPPVMTIHPQSITYLHCAGCPLLAKYMKFKWHIEQKWGV